MRNRAEGTRVRAPTLMEAVLLNFLAWSIIIAGVFLLLSLA